MGTITYLNIYIYAILGFIGALLFGCVFFYTGMETTSFVVSTNLGQTTYYLDYSQYKIYYQGFIYCLTFAIAGFLLLIVMALPTEEILGRQRTVMTSGTPMSSPITPPMAPPQAPPTGPPTAPPVAPQPPPSQPPVAALQKPSSPAVEQKEEQEEAPLETDIDQLEDEFETTTTEERTDESGDSDVVFGTGRITEDSIVSFINQTPDSAIKFLYRRNLNGKALTPEEEKIYQSWQKRGLSRASVRDYILQMMEWEALPKDKTLMDIATELRDQIFELTY